MTLHCLLCGNETKEGATCEKHKEVWYAIHNFVHEWHDKLPEEVTATILKAPHVYSPETGKRYEEEPEASK